MMSYIQKRFTKGLIVARRIKTLFPKNGFYYGVIQRELRRKTSVHKDFKTPNNVLVSVTYCLEGSKIV